MLIDFKMQAIKDQCSLARYNSHQLLPTQTQAVGGEGSCRPSSSHTLVNPSLLVVLVWWVGLKPHQLLCLLLLQRGMRFGYLKKQFLLLFGCYLYNLWHSFLFCCTQTHVGGISVVVCAFMHICMCAGDKKSLWPTAEDHFRISSTIIVTIVLMYMHSRHWRCWFTKSRKSI